MASALNNLQRLNKDTDIETQKKRKHEYTINAIL